MISLFSYHSIVPHPTAHPPRQCPQPSISLARSDLGERQSSSGVQSVIFPRYTMSECGGVQSRQNYITVSVTSPHANNSARQYLHTFAYVCICLYTVLLWMYYPTINSYTLLYAASQFSSVMYTILNIKKRGPIVLP